MMMLPASCRGTSIGLDADMDMDIAAGDDGLLEQFLMQLHGHG